MPCHLLLLIILLLMAIRIKNKGNFSTPIPLSLYQFQIPYNSRYSTRGCSAYWYNSYPLPQRHLRNQIIPPPLRGHRRTKKVYCIQNHIPLSLHSEYSCIVSLLQVHKQQISCHHGCGSTEHSRSMLFVSCKTRKSMSPWVPHGTLGEAWAARLCAGMMPLTFHGIAHQFRLHLAE